MKTFAIIAVFILGLTVPAPGQNASPVAKPAPKPPKTQPTKPAKTESPVSKLFGNDATNSKEPITTEIYSDEAFFDSSKNMGIFTGRVKVTDPRFNLQSDKLTVFISKAQSEKGTPNGQASPGAQASPSGQAAQGEQAGQGQGLEKAIAEGNVGLVRDRPDPNGGPPTRAVGRSEKATYVAATGDCELTGSPRVQQGVNMHIATSPDTVMVINQNGQLTTHGPSRTEIRQEPKDGDDDKDGDNKGEKKDDKDKKPGDKKEKKDKKPKPSASPSQ